MAKKKPFIVIENVFIRLQDTVVVRGINWEIKEGEQWVILGPNGSGKSTLVRSLFGGTNLVRGTITFLFEKDPKKRTHPALMKDQIGYVSFELHQKLMEQEDFLQTLRKFKGALDEEYTSAKDVMISGIVDGKGRARTLPEEGFARQIKTIAAHLGISYLLDRNITALSTGEMRKTLIARSLMKDPRLLILDEPFDGLDGISRESLKDTIERLSQNLQLILITHRVDEIPACITHALLVKDGSVQQQGPKVQVLSEGNLKSLYDLGETPRVSASAHRLGIRVESESPSAVHVPEVLIEMKHVRICYGDTVALDDLSWMMKKGEHWAIVGPNGSGKSTIAKLILGENVQGYANDIWLFGRKKGTGETMWDIKKYIGAVSGELQVQYRKNMTALDVVASGFYDSIGLYRYPTKEQDASAREWVERLGIKDIAENNFHQLSYGQRRMVLLARAMVKSPVLLILDEPCHGLDIPNRTRVLGIIEFIGSHTSTTLLYITHYREEIVSCITRVLELKKGMKVREGKVS